MFLEEHLYYRKLYVHIDWDEFGPAKKERLENLDYR